jgi:hypothetical protein
VEGAETRRETGTGQHPLNHDPSFSLPQALALPYGGHDDPRDPCAMSAAAAARSLLVAVAGFLFGLLVAAVALPVAAHAQDVAAPPPSTTRSVVVYGDDPCPASKGDEIVVCARQPESERYRIPKRFRGEKASQSPAGNSFANKFRSTEDNSRAAAGVPNSCSAVGSGGQSGCFLQMQRQAAAARLQEKNRQQDAESPDQP